MPILLGAVADDYTGASDLANTFSKNGLRTVQTIGVPPDDVASIGTRVRQTTWRDAGSV